VTAERTLRRAHTAHRVWGRTVAIEDTPERAAGGGAQSSRGIAQTMGSAQRPCAYATGRAMPANRQPHFSATRQEPMFRGSIRMTMRLSDIRRNPKSIIAVTASLVRP